MRLGTKMGAYEPKLIDIVIALAFLAIVAISIFTLGDKWASGFQ